MPVGGRSLSAEKIMLRTFLSANLRILLPTFGLFGIGLLIDFWAGSKLFWTVIGLAIGATVSVILVVLQIKNIRKAKK
jgi:ABC-type anion transport system duplicated permease subunit